ncbi:transketolase [Kiritimatiella glycovorans]|uniref:Transketolase n=1 Tax=Kiritimatiella glycovorans TaxID=1307763 RepID=A0A0G3ELK5_9BACT|nr:transketolase [Kiritimatiella glycovorans]AKJ65024.1 Transketolase 1 [Kiritimatiella glycovorans]
MNRELIANTIRGLSMDGVEAAKSGHPGMPMGMADVATVLWTKYLRHNPANPDWADRDRFVLSAGHGSMLLYSLLHLAGYDLPLDQLNQFRQWGSRTPGHPEYGHTTGVETTTGPLGQGCCNAVGFALAEQMLAARFNTDETSVVDHRTWVIASDGDLMEGASHEAFALAGHLKLGRLVVLYDDNNISIEGDTDLSYSDDVRKRFEGYHWNVLEIDGHDYDEIDAALEKACACVDAPTLVICHTRIGKGSPNMEGSEATHGAALGEDEVEATKKALGLPTDELFHVPDEVRTAFAEVAEQGAAAEREWNERFAQWRKADGERAALWDLHMSGDVPADLAAHLPEFKAGDKIATRKASGAVIQKMAAAYPPLVGGSADLAPSNKSLIDDGGDVAAGCFGPRNLHFGVRELGMTAILNGLALHGGFRPYGATFLVFADFMRPAIRLAALMKQPAVYVLTHDSFYVGEDGPTHEPIETLASLRIIPNMTVIRPSDATETGAAWVQALKHREGPTALLLTRQGLPVIDREECAPAANLERGAYTLWESGDGTPQIILIGSGSEVDLALQAGRRLADEGTAVRVVSMPSRELFEAQDESYRKSVLPPEVECRLAVEAGVTYGWERYTGAKGRVIGIDHFGASAPAARIAQEFGFTVDHVYETACEMVK